jgi:hypothetical protein
MERNFVTEPVGVTKREIPFVVEAVNQRKRTIEIGRVLTRKRKGEPDGPSYNWAVVRDFVTAAPTADADATEYGAVLCEGVEGSAGQWFVYRLYFTNNRHGNRHFGQNCIQCPLATDQWLTKQILDRGWYDKLPK